MSSDNEDNLIVPDIGVNALEEEIVQNLQNQIQVNIVYHKDDDQEKKHDSFIIKQRVPTSRATDHFIMSNSNVQFPVALGQNKKFIGKDTTTNKNCVPSINYFKKSAEPMKSFSLIEKMQPTQPTPLNNNECKNTLTSINNNNTPSASTTECMKINPLLMGKLITIPKNKTSLIKDSDDSNVKKDKKIESPISSLLNKSKSTGTDISLVKASIEKNVNQKSSMKQNEIDFVNEPKVKDVRVMLCRLKMNCDKIPIKKKLVAKKSCFRAGKTVTEIKKNFHIKNEMKLSSQSALIKKPIPTIVTPESASPSSLRELEKFSMLQNNSNILNNNTQIKVSSSSIINKEGGRQSTAAIRKNEKNFSSNAMLTSQKLQKCVEVQTEFSFGGICGLVDWKNFFINCFYCRAHYDFENWVQFVTHVRFEHQIEENADDHTDHTYATFDEDMDEDDCVTKTDDNYYQSLDQECLNGNDNDARLSNELHDKNTSDDIGDGDEIDEAMKKQNKSLMDTGMTGSVQVNILTPNNMQIADRKNPKTTGQQKKQSLDTKDNDDEDEKDSIESLLKILRSPNDEQQQSYVEDRRSEESTKTSRTGRSNCLTDIDNDGEVYEDNDDLDIVYKVKSNEHNDTENNDNDNSDWKFGDLLSDDDELDQFAGFEDESSDNDNNIVKDECVGINETIQSEKEKVCEISDDEMPSNDENEDEEPKPTAGCGILFGLTNRSVCEEFLKNLALFPILYSPDVECTRNTYDIYITKLCVYLNRKFLLGITDLEMRLSIQRVNDWYARTMYKMRQHEKNSPNEPYKHRFPHYFEMCKIFLPKNHLPHKLVDGEGAQFKRHNKRRVYPPWVKTRIEDVKQSLVAANDGTEESEKVLGLPEVTIDDVRQFLIKKNKTTVDNDGDISNAESWQEIRRKATKAQKNKSWERIKPNEQGDFQCDVCGREYTVWKKFRAHKYTHQPPKFKCEICDKKFMRNYFRQKHIEAVHMASKPITTKSTERKSQTALNKRTEYKCDQCDKAYTKMSSLREHKQRHAPPRYQCEKCKKMFYSNSSLINHEQSSRCHQQPHICEYCGKAIYSRSTFRIHKKTKHLNIRQWYTCVVCNHKSQSKRYLIHHQQRHHPALEGTLEQLARKTNPQGMRLVHFSEEYRKGYLWRNSLRRPGMKVYSCLTCHVTFERYKDVLHHNKEKHPIRHGTYECQLCPPPGKLLMRSSLRRHYTVIHKVPIEELEMVLSRTKPVLPPSNSEANTNADSMDVFNNTFNSKKDEKSNKMDNKTQVVNTYLEVKKKEDPGESAETEVQEQMEYFLHKEEVEEEVVDNVGESAFVDEEFNASQYMVQIDEEDREVKEAVTYVEKCMLENNMAETEEEGQMVIVEDADENVYMVDNFDFLVEEIIESNDGEEEDKKPDIYILDD